MAFKRPKARILERTTTSGSGPFALAAVRDDFNRFSSFMSIGDTTDASVVEPGVAFWTGVVTYSATNQITLTTVEETSGTFGAGTKEIFAGTLSARSAFPLDIAGAIVTGGTSSAFTVASFRVYDSLARMANQLIGFTPHAQNAANPTLNVDGLGAKPLRFYPGADMPDSSLIPGTPYVAIYNNSDAAFYLQGAWINPYNIPIAGCLDYFGTTTPNSAFAFPRGQAISRVTFANLFSIIGTTFGIGNGVDTFNLPDLSGRVTAMLELSATRLTSTYFGGNSTAMGAGGTDHTSNTILKANLPVTNLTSDAQQTTVFVTVLNNQRGSNSGTIVTGMSVSGGGGTDSASFPVGNQNVPLGGSGTALAVGSVQPTFTCNKIFRVI